MRLRQSDTVTIAPYGQDVEAYVLTVVDGTALVEYERSGATSALAFVNVATGDRPPVARSPYGYERLPLKWLKALGDVEWIGNAPATPVVAGQVYQGTGRVVLFPLDAKPDSTGEATVRVGVR